MAYQQPYDPYCLQQPEYAYSNDSRNTINTLFVSGLPDGVKAREIHNLFRPRPGFDSCQLKYTGRGNQVVAFATFINHQSAMAALNDVKFDPSNWIHFAHELARSNSRRKRKPGSGVYVVIDNRNKASTDAQETSSDDGDSDSNDPSGPKKTDSGNKDDSELAKSGETELHTDDAVAAENDQADTTLVEGVQSCSTLFIANLGPTCTEDELKQVLSQYTGLNTLKVRARSGMPVAFAD